MGNVVFIILGVIAAVTGLAMFVFTFVDYKSYSLPVKATITKVNKRFIYNKVNKKIDFFIPTLTYVVDGKIYTYAGAFGTVYETFYKINDPFDIYVNPKNPEKVYVKPKIRMLILGVILIILGGVLIYCYYIK